jgi:hypothetical protein
MSIAAYYLQFDTVSFTQVFSEPTASPVTYVNVTIDGKVISGFNATLVSTTGIAPGPWITTFAVTGIFGEDIATNHTFITVKQPELTERSYTDYDTMMADFGKNWDIVRYYAPDATPTKTAIFNFLYQGTPIPISTTVYTVPTRWYSRLQTICQSIRPNRVTT